MLVFNLTSQELIYKGHTIPRDGGSVSLPELDKFIPDRDRELEEKKVLAFGSLPYWWTLQQGIKNANLTKTASDPKTIKIKVADTVKTTDAVMIESTPVKLEVEQMRPAPAQDKEFKGGKRK
jgi:hypothetical protein